MRLELVNLLDRVLWHAGLQRRAVAARCAGTVAYSQEGEDMLLKRIFQDQPKGFYVDVGAHHPVVFSNTCLLYRRGWRGINIDAMPGSMALFNRMRPGDINIECGVAEQEGDLTYFCYEKPALNTVDPHVVEAFRRHGISPLGERTIHVRPLADILAQALPEPPPLDMMSIDVEGVEMSVLRSNNWDVYRPRVLVVEQHVTGVAEALGSELPTYLEQKGYLFIAKTLNTLCFAEDTFARELAAAL